MQGSGIFIGEYFSSLVRDARRKLVSYRKKARCESKKVTKAYDHLIIKGKKFTMDDKDNLKELK